MARADIIRTTTWTAGDVANLIDAMDYGKDTWGGVSGGSANAQTITVSPTPSAYANGQTFTFYATYTNTASATLNVNSLGATTIRNAKTGAVLVGGEIFATGVYRVVYYNSLFYLLNPSVSSATWVPTVGGFSVAPTNTSYYYQRIGQLVICYFRQATPGASNATSFTITAPVAAKTITNMVWTCQLISAQDNSVNINTGIATISSGSSTINLYKDHSGAGWTAANNKGANGTLIYEAA